MEDDQVRSIVEEVLAEGQYNVAKVPYHDHNGVDSSFVVTNLFAGTGITLATNTITVQPNSMTSVSGDVTITNVGVTSITAGTGVTVTPSGGTGAVTVGVPTSLGRFGGDGSDGALSINSGTTTLAIGTQPSLTKNYSSISVTGTGLLNFSSSAANGSVAILKSTGNVTITTSGNPAISVVGIGAQPTSSNSSPATSVPSAGAGGAGPVGGGSGGGAGTSSDGSAVPGGGAGISYGPGIPGGGGYNVAATATVGGISPQIIPNLIPKAKMVPMACGGSGAYGGTGPSGAGGVGGTGGGCLYIECAGVLTLTTGTLACYGGNGGAGTGNSSSGGGGGGGSIIILYNSLATSSASFAVYGGTGGVGGRTGGDGGPGFSIVAQNTEFP